jgi:hypothetical protein
MTSVTSLVTTRDGAGEMIADAGALISIKADTDSAEPSSAAEIAFMSRFLYRTAFLD